MDNINNDRIGFKSTAFKISLKERERQMNKATAVNFSSNDEIMNSINILRKAKNEKSSDITVNSKVNEQDLFASLVHLSLKQIDSKLGDEYAQKLPDLIKDVSKFDSENAVLKAAKRSLYKLVKLRKLSNGAAKIIRRIVVGKSQLDDNLTNLSTKRLENAKETPLRAVKTALERIVKNNRASEEQFLEYRKNTKELKLA